MLITCPHCKKPKGVYLDKRTLNGEFENVSCYCYCKKCSAMFLVNFEFKGLLIDEMKSPELRQQMKETGLIENTFDKGEI